MPAVIESVIKDSIADELEFKQDDIILSINKIEMVDFFDYRFLTMAEEVEIHLKRKDGTEEIFEIEKDFEEDLGVVFKSAVFDKLKKCTNKCVFCFIDQQPEGLRDSLYVKDDDYRLSALQGTYITLTNLTKKDRERIEKLRIGPLYVSVHATDERVREFMLKHKRAGDILKELSWLDSLDIPMHTQIVLCPTINDGEILTKTLNDLAGFKNNMLSIAVVPVGVTNFRQDDILHTVDKKSSIGVVNEIEKLNKKLGYNLAFASDEFYLKAEKALPSYDDYEDFSQLENGIGMTRMLWEDFEQRKHLLPACIDEKKDFRLVTGALAEKALKPIVDELNKIENFNIELTIIKSSWGKGISVAGLMTGADIVEQLTSLPPKSLLVPSVALRSYSDDFLDGMTLNELKKTLAIEVKVIQDCYSTKELIKLTA